MTITKEISASDYKYDLAWSGARDRVEEMTVEEVERIFDILEDTFCDRTPSLTEINDFFWFDGDTWAEWLGYRDEEHFSFCRSHNDPERVYMTGDGKYLTEEAVRGIAEDYMRECKNDYDGYLFVLFPSFGSDEDPLSFREYLEEYCDYASAEDYIEANFEELETP